MIVLLTGIFLLYVYFILKYKTNQNIDLKNDLKISVIIAAKNEEKNLPKLIQSLIDQKYSKENFEVIIVDDNSSDKTFILAKNLTSDFDNFQIIKANKKEYLGKRGALQFGINKSTYQYILITDADCITSDNWINSFANYFNQGNDFLFGVAPYYQKNNSTENNTINNVNNKSTFANKIACFDNLWVHILTFSSANIGLPYSAAARSFGFRKDSFYSIKGYKNTTDTLSGDNDLLLREAVKNKLKIGTVTNKNAFVYSFTENNLIELINQKSRHTSTSNYYSLKIKIVLGIWHFLNLFMFLGIVLSLININFLILFVIKFLGDLIIINSLMKKFSYKFNFLEIIYLQFIYELLLVVNYIKGSLFKSKW